MASERKNAEGGFPWDSHWSLPTQCGYLKIHPTAAQARKAAMRSRDACVLLLARCSMAIALCTSPTDIYPRWIGVLQGQVPGPWIDILRNSVVSQFAPGLRTGAFIELSGKTAWVHHVPCMIRAHLPVYICWNAPVEETVARYPFLADFVPPTSQLLVVHEMSERRLRFRWPAEDIPRPADDLPAAQTSVPWRTERVEGYACSGGEEPAPEMRVPVATSNPGKWACADRCIYVNMAHDRARTWLGRGASSTPMPINNPQGSTRARTEARQDLH